MTMTVPASVVRKAGITAEDFAQWAMEKARDGKPDHALRLLDASAALVREEAALGHDV